MQNKPFNADDFEFESLEQELQADQHCQRLLLDYYNWLQQNGMTPQEATQLAYSADYYLRDYLLDHLRANPLKPQDGIVRYFAGNWYIVKNMEPEQKQLSQHLLAIQQLYTYIKQLELITQEELNQLMTETLETDFYTQRIADFLALAGDGYTEWDNDCTINMVTR